MEDSSAVLMESLKVCLTETVLRNGCLSLGPEGPVMGVSLLQALEFSVRNQRFFLQMHLYQQCGRCDPVLEDVTVFQFLLF